jgi:prolyl 4-hydroxylase
MVYLHAECTGGGTNFPRLPMPKSKEWCRLLECDGDREGITFKPVKGSAVYWENFKSDGSGYEETWHAGLPVESGVKVGLNIWSWYQPGHMPTKGEEAGV